MLVQDNKRADDAGQVKFQKIAEEGNQSGVNRVNLLISKAR